MTNYIFTHGLDLNNLASLELSCRIKAISINSVAIILIYCTSVEKVVIIYQFTVGKKTFPVFWVTVDQMY